MSRISERFVVALALALAMPAAAAEVPAPYREVLMLAAGLDASEAYCALEPQELGRKLVAYARTLGTDPATLAAMEAEAEAARTARSEALKADAVDCRDLDFLVEKIQAEKAFRAAFAALVEKTLLPE